MVTSEEEAGWVERLARAGDLHQSSHRAVVPVTANDAALGIATQAASEGAPAHLERQLEHARAYHLCW